MNGAGMIASVGVAMLTVREGRLCAVLQRRPEDPDEPFPGMLGIVSGGIWPDVDADADATARRLVESKAGLRDVFVEQLMTFSGPDRDPNGYSVLVAYYALVASDRLAEAVASGRLVVMDVAETLKADLAYDHARIVDVAVRRVRGKGSYSVLPARLLPDEFTLSDLLATYQAVIGQKIDKANFRRKMTAFGILAETGATRQTADATRPAAVYRLRKDADVFDRRV